MNDVTDMEQVINTAVRSAKPHPLDSAGRFFSVLVPGSHDERGEHIVIDMDAERAERPDRKRGTFTVQDADSFVAYLDKHALPQTEVWADLIGTRIVAVINAHMGQTGDGIEDYAGWQDHRVTYSVKPTKSWETWLKYDGELLDQASFAEIIEDRAIDVVLPSGADMLELAQSFQATTGVSFESSKALSSGERQLEYKETIDARAGKRGQLTIPKEFALALVPFEGADAFKVIARFRYRITNGVLRLGYRLQRPEDVVREAFLSVVDKVAEEIDAPVFRGTTAG